MLTTALLSARTFSIAVGRIDSCARIRLGGRIVPGAATLALSEARSICLLPPAPNWVIGYFARVDQIDAGALGQLAMGCLMVRANGIKYGVTGLSARLREFVCPGVARLGL